jgi:diadenylate cyclase
LLDILSQIRWQDILDILLVSIILYRVILIIKGTRAAKMLVGIGVLLVASFFSKYLQLYTMDWLVQSFWAQVVVALIVLFSPRSAGPLPKWGSRPSFRDSPPQKN